MHGSLPQQELVPSRVDKSNKIWISWLTISPDLKRESSFKRITRVVQRSSDSMQSANTLQFPH